jgi:primase-polymerase (primpol)-like protein
MTIKTASEYAREYWGVDGCNAGYEEAEHIIQRAMDTAARQAREEALEEAADLCDAAQQADEDLMKLYNLKTETKEHLAHNCAAAQFRYTAYAIRQLKEQP